MYSSAGDFGFWLSSILVSFVFFAPPVAFINYYIKNQRYKAVGFPRFCPNCSNPLAHRPSPYCQQCGWRGQSKPKFPVWAAILWGLLCSFIFFMESNSYTSSSFDPATTLRSPTPSHRPPTPIYIPSTPTSVYSSCLHWSRVSTQMLGQNICVYGTIYSAQGRRRFDFSPAKNTFFMMNANDYYYPEASPSSCVLAWGTVQVFQGKVPFIYISDLYHCQDWMYQ